MLIAWKTELFKLEAVEQGAFLLSAKLLDCNLRISWWISCIYSFASNTDKEEFWLKLSDLGNLTEGPWYIGGHFSKVLYSEDMNTRRSSNVQRRTFHEWVTKFGLIVIPTNNIQFTWSNDRENLACS